MKKSLKHVASLTMLPLAGVMVLAILAGCSESKTATVQTEAKAPAPAPVAPEPPPPAPEPPPAVAQEPPPAAPEPPPAAPEPPPAAPEPPPPPQKEEIVAQAAVAPTEDPLAWAASLADVHFDYDKSVIRKSEQDKLAAAAKVLKEDGKRKVVVEGHCDERGTASYNMALGERRARAVKRYLADLGVAGSQIQTTSFGKERPLCTDSNEDCYQRNRRGHFTAQ